MPTFPELVKRVRPGPAVALAVGAALVAAAAARTPSSPQGNPPPQPTEKPETYAMPVGSGATADSNNRMIAVTGVDVTGASVLYLVDTERMSLGVYQATSTGSNQGVRFVGSRRIELDMQLDGFNDRSEYTYKQLKSEFERSGLFPAEGAPQDSVPKGSVPKGN